MTNTLNVLFYLLATYIPAETVLDIVDLNYMELHISCFSSFPDQKDL